MFRFLLSENSHQLLQGILLLILLLVLLLPVRLPAILRRILGPAQEVLQCSGHRLRVAQIRHQPLDLHLCNLLNIRREFRIGEGAGQQGRNYQFPWLLASAVCMKPPILLPPTF